MGLGLNLSSYIPLAIYSCAIIAIILTLFYKIEIGIIFLIMIIPLTNIQTAIVKYPSGKDIIDFVLISMLIKWIIAKKSQGDKIFKSNRLNVPIILLIGWTFLSLWHGPNTPQNPLDVDSLRLKDWLIFIKMPLLFFIIVNNIKEEKYFKIFILMMFFCIFMMSIQFQANFYEPTHFSHASRSAGVFEYLGPNALAIFVAQFTSVLLAFFLYEKKNWLHILYVLALAGSYYMIMFTYSRSGYIIVLIVLLFLGVTKTKSLLFVLVLLYVFWKMLLPLSVQERIEMIHAEDGYDATIEQRLDMWEQGKQLIESNLIMGTGFGSTSSLNIVDNISHIHRNSLHNGIIQYTLELGIIGLTVFLWILAVATKEGYRLYSNASNTFEKTLGIGFLTYLTAVFATFLIANVWKYLEVNGYFWICLACVAKINNIKFDKLSEKIKDKLPNKKDNSF
jgi:putative inorganic carbon (HCO3(-)) transporter